MAINLGEIPFSPRQCTELAVAIEKGGVSFFYASVDADSAQRLRGAVRAQRLRRMVAGDEPWIYSPLAASHTQNRLIHRASRFWFNPASLRRNERFVQLRLRLRVAMLAHVRRRIHSLREDAPSRARPHLAPGLRILAPSGDAGPEAERQVAEAQRRAAGELLADFAHNAGARSPRCDSPATSTSSPELRRPFGADTGQSALDGDAIVKRRRSS